MSRLLREKPPKLEWYERPSEFDNPKIVQNPLWQHHAPRHVPQMDRVAYEEHLARVSGYPLKPKEVEKLWQTYLLTRALH